MGDTSENTGGLPWWVILSDRSSIKTLEVFSWLTNAGFNAYVPQVFERGKHRAIFAGYVFVQCGDWTIDDIRPVIRYKKFLAPRGVIARVTALEIEDMQRAVAACAVVPKPTALRGKIIKKYSVN